MEIALMNQRVHQTPEYKLPIKNSADARRFFHLLWFDLGLDFNPDDDFEGYGVFDEEAAQMLNQRMDEAFEILGSGIHDVALSVMSSDK